MNLSLFNGGAAAEVQTMSTREIAALIGKQHNHIKVSAERLAANGVIGTPATREFDHNGNTYTEYLLNKRDSIILVAQNCPEFTAAIVDRWQELESGEAAPMVTATPQRSSVSIGVELANAMQGGVFTKSEAMARFDAWFGPRNAAPQMTAPNPKHATSKTAAALQGHKNTMRKAWAHGDEEIRNGIPYVARHVLLDYLVSVCGKKTKTALNTVSPHGTMMGQLLEDGFCETHGNGWMINF